MIIKLELEEEEVNYIINTLGQRAFIEVFELIPKIQRQGQQQLAAVREALEKK